MHDVKPALLFVALSLFVQTTHAEQSDDSAFFLHRSQHAYNAVFGLPAVAARPVQTQEWQVSLEHANQFTGGTAADEILLLDGETSELSIRLRQRIGPCWQSELTLPFIQHSGGRFDRAISDWHNFFGFPNAQRDTSPVHAISYQYTNEAEAAEVAAVNQPQSGLGDIQLSIQRSLGCYATADATQSETIARLGLKLPTGDADELRGSGKFDIYTDLQSPVWALGSRIRLGASLGIMLVGDSDQLPDQHDLIAYGAMGTQWIWTQRLRILAQLDWHTPFYKSDLHELGDVSAGFTVGARFLGTDDQTLELSVSEDALVDTIPDIVLRLSWTYRPAGGL